MADNHEQSTSQSRPGTSNGADSGLIVQDPLTNLLANVLGKQQEAQERQMEILDRMARKERKVTGQA